MPKADFFRRRPLFYAALLFCGGILAVALLAPGFFYSIPKNDIYWTAREKPEEITVRGKIVSEVDEKDSFYGQKYDVFVLNCASVSEEGDPEKAVGGKIRVSVTEPQSVFRYGDIVSIDGRLAPPPGQRNPGGFDYAAYLDRQGIRALLYAGKNSDMRVLSSGNGNFWVKEAGLTRNFLSENLSKGFSEEDTAFLKALLWGDRGDISADFQELFIRTGTMHILAVSGFNVGFLTAAILFLLWPLRLPKNIQWTVVLVMIWLFCLLVGWQAPLVRASVMATILILGKLLGKRSDLLNSLGLAAIIILVVQPKSLFDIGFQLSFLAVAGLALFMPIFVKEKELFPNEKFTIREKISIYAAELFWVSFVATFTTLPVTVQSFYIVTPLSLLANMIVVPLSFWLFFCGIVYFLTFWWVPKFLFFVPLLMKGMMQVFTRSLAWIGNLPGACITVGKLFWPLEVLLIAGLFYLFFEPRFRSRGARAAALFLFSLNVFLCQDALRHFDRRFTMTVLDVGQGDSIYIEFPGGGNLLMDAGKGEPADQGRRVIVPFLRSKGVRRIDIAAISHPQADHIGGMETVLKEFEVAHFLDPQKFYASRLYRSLREEIFLKRIPYEKAGRGGEIDGFADIKIQILNPDPDTKVSRNVNNDCIVLKITYRKTSFLLTGDIEKPAMKEMAAAGVDLHADVLKVPHHGAKLDESGKEFIESVSPRISVISVGEHNPFHHPRQETLDTLSSIPGNRIFRTDRQGAVSVSSNGEVVAPNAFLS